MNKIVFKGKTKDGTSYVIRYPKRTDSRAVWKYINDLSQEKTYISFQGEDIPLEQERKFVNAAIKQIKERQSVILFVISDNQVLGISDIRSGNRIGSHVGTFGISLDKKFRGQGIGKKLMEVVLEEAKKNIKTLKIIKLECFGNNPVAQEMYMSFGFKEFGRLPNGIAYKEQFVDDVCMYYEVKP